ncbi:MAG: PASTA domain-containing protein [Ilumatobacteraceae bacterium]
MSVFENHDPESLIDTLVDGRFRLRTEISRSGSSTVFVAEDQRDGSEVAVRLFAADVSGRRGEALLDQARAAAEMSHPNVVRTTGFGRTTVAGASRVYVAQERLTGGTLQDMLDRGRLLTPSQALAVGVDVCRALDYAHKRGLTHFDLRPSAIVFGDDRRARVADLGVASVVSEDAWADTTTVSLERARYCAPEQATGEPFDEKADVYALALILSEAVSGSVPFLADSVVTTLGARVDKLFPVSADLGGLASVLEKAGRSDPLERSGASDMGRALVQAAPSLPRPAALPIVSTSIFDGDRTGDIPRPSPSASTPSASIPAATGTMEIIDGEPNMIVDEPTADVPLIGRWIVAAVAVLAVVVGGFVLFKFIQKDSHEIPMLTGIDVGEATNLVTEFDWTIVEVEEASEDVPAGAVVRTDPEAGRSLQSGKTITFFVSTGPPPVPLPELNNLDVPAATTALNEAGLVLGAQTPEFSEDIATGLVIRWVVSLQPNLVAGQEVVKGTAVDVFVSQGPAPRVIPDLRGMTIENATIALNDIQLIINRADDEFSNDVPVGGVATQLPAAGESLPKGSSVTVAISKGPDVVPMPNLATITNLDAVKQAITNAGLTVGTVTGRVRGAPIAAVVGGQVVAPGQLLPRGSVVDIVYYG